MPVWFWIFLAVFIPHVILVFVMSPPEAVANWFVGKFETHRNLTDDVHISRDGTRLDAENTKQVIEDFNSANFLDRYYQFFPTYTTTPLVIRRTEGKRPVTLFLYADEHHVTVVKQVNKKTVAYRLASQPLHNLLVEMNRGQELNHA